MRKKEQQYKQSTAHYRQTDVLSQMEVSAIWYKRHATAAYVMVIHADHHSQITH